MCIYMTWFTKHRENKYLKKKGDARLEGGFRIYLLDLGWLIEKKVCHFDFNIVHQSDQNLIYRNNFSCFCD